MKFILAFFRVLCGLVLLTASFLVLVDPRRFAFRAEDLVTWCPAQIFLIVIVILAVLVFTTAIMLLTGLKIGSFAFMLLAVLIAVDATVMMPRVDFYEHAVGTDESGIVSPYGQSVALVVWDKDRLSEEYWERVHEMRRMSNDYEKNFYILTEDGTIPEQYRFSRIDSAFLERGFCEELQVVQVDLRTMRNIMPSNGGAVLFTDGIIAEKLPQRWIYSRRMLDAMACDADFSVADNSARERVFLSSIFFALLILVIIIRHKIKLAK